LGLKEDGEKESERNNEDEEGEDDVDREEETEQDADRRGVDKRPFSERVLDVAELFLSTIALNDWRSITSSLLLPLSTSPDSINDHGQAGDVRVLYDCLRWMLECAIDLHATQQSHHTRSRRIALVSRTLDIVLLCVTSDVNQKLHKLVATNWETVSIII